MLPLIRRREEVFKSGLTVLVTTASGKTVWPMVSADLFMLKATSTKENGPTTKQMVMASTLITMALVMRVIGTKINSTVGALKNGPMKPNTREITTLA